MRPTRLFPLVVLCVLAISNTASAQHTFIPAIMTQSIIPYSDHGQWVPVDLYLTNQDTVPDLCNFYFPNYSRPSNDSYGEWCIDTVRGNRGDLNFDTTFWMAPHSKTPDIVFHVFFRSEVPDSTALFIQGSGFNDIILRGKGNCAPVKGFWDPSWGTISNWVYPAEVGTKVSRPFDGAWHLTDIIPTETPYTASFDIVGEYDSLFHITYPTTVKPFTKYDVQISFDGTSKRVVHDTIVGTFTNCLGTFTRRTPVDGFSIYTKSHTIRVVSDTGRLAMLGRKVDSIVVANLTDVPMVVTQFWDNPSNPSQYKFRLPTSGVVPVPPRDSVAILVDVKDNIYYDLHNTSASMSDRYGFSFRFPGNDGLVTDTTVTGSFFDVPDLFDPLYLSITTPELKAGIKPSGILFDCGHAPFLLPFRNYEKESYTYYQPYFDEPHITVTISIPLPASIPANAQLLDATIKNTCDPHYDYHTFMHWPRKRDRDGFRDTINIEVAVIGGQAVHTLAVSELPRPVAALWPNPTNGLLHLKLERPISGEVMVFDLLGQQLLQKHFEGSDLQLDLSELPTGLYEIRIPAIGIVEKVRVVK